jgi:nitroreductase
MSHNEEHGLHEGTHEFAVATLPGREGALTAIYERRSVRAYSQEPVARDQIEALLDAAIHAPSAVNLQPWAFIVIEEPQLLKRYADEAVTLMLAEPVVAEITNSRLPEFENLREMVAGPNFELFHGAPALIVIYSTAMDSTCDCYLAAENLMLAAWAIGLGTCPIGLATPFFNRAEVKAELGISPDWSVALPVVVGHPSGPLVPTGRQEVEIIAWR